ncbi:hypothetical protein [Planktothrix phage Pra-JY27]|nr:hypothetical protein [Planktothrix phage Pag-Yong1]WEV89221.1 DUF5320 domain-containing protein [Synechococcus phage MinM2]
MSEVASGGVVLYRVEDIRYAAPADEFGDPQPGRGTFVLVIHEHQVARVTPKGWRLKCGRFVLREANKRFACPTVQEAFDSYEARRNRQIRILEARLQDARLGTVVLRRARSQFEAGKLRSWQEVRASWSDTAEAAGVKLSCPTC